MNTYGSEIYLARKKIKDFEEQRTLAKERLKLLELRTREIQGLIADGAASGELARGLVSVQDEIKRTQSHLSMLKSEIKKYNANATTLEKAALDDIRNNGNLMQVDVASLLIIKDLSELLAKYQLFSSDHTRVSSMRLMASQFSSEINEILKRRAA